MVGIALSKGFDWVINFYKILEQPYHICYSNGLEKLSIIRTSIFKMQIL